MNNPFTDIETSVRNYVLGKMTDDETDQFEEYYLSNPDIIEMVEITQNIHIGLQNAELSQAAEPNVNPVPNKWLRTLINWVSIPMPAYAAVALAIVAGPLAMNSFYTSSNIDTMNVANFATVATRGAKAPIEIDLSELNQPTGVFVKVRQVDYQYYILKLTAADSAQVNWVSEPFEVSSLRDKLLVIPDSVERSNVAISVYGIEREGIETPVEFCHYSEVCK
jgi:hypothetical protein